MRARIVAAFWATSLVACSATGFDLQRASARAMTPTPYPDSVTISDVRRDRLGNVRKWVATSRDGVFDCSLEDQERTPLCARRDARR
ncbi:MAG TPA: hypothetical protein VFN38_09915 [Gemmatimonadaceae bacterium]|nr:hypothetical protein [Gemmatimonadaceae bacterium]